MGKIDARIVERPSADLAVRVAAKAARVCCRESEPLEADERRRDLAAGLDRLRGELDLRVKSRIRMYADKVVDRVGAKTDDVKSGLISQGERELHKQTAGSCGVGLAKSESIKLD